LHRTLCLFRDLGGALCLFSLAWRITISSTTPTTITITTDFEEETTVSVDSITSSKYSSGTASAMKKNTIDTANESLSSSVDTPNTPSKKRVSISDHVTTFDHHKNAPSNLTINANATHSQSPIAVLERAKTVSGPLDPPDDTDKPDAPSNDNANGNATTEAPVASRRVSGAFGAKNPMELMRAASMGAMIPPKSPKNGEHMSQEELDALKHEDGKTQHYSKLGSAFVVSSNNVLAMGGRGGRGGRGRGGR